MPRGRGLRLALAEPLRGRPDVRRAARFGHLGRIPEFAREYLRYHRAAVNGIIIDRAGYESAFMLTAAVAAVGAAWWAVAVPKIEPVRLD